MIIRMAVRSDLVLSLRGLAAKEKGGKDHNGSSYDARWVFG